MRWRSPLLGALQLPPKRRAQGFFAVYAQPVRFATAAARGAGSGNWIRIRVRFNFGWGRVKNLWRNDCGATGKPYPLNETQPLSHGTEGRTAVRSGGPRWFRIFFMQNRLRYGTGTGTDTWTWRVHSFSRRFRCAVRTGVVRNAGGAARRRWGGGKQFDVLKSVLSDPKLGIFFL